MHTPAGKKTNPKNEKVPYDSRRGKGVNHQRGLVQVKIRLSKEKAAIERY